MKKHLYKICTIFTVVLFLGCFGNPKPIQYGVDNCQFCEMTIVDDRHSSELVTNKGKVFKFDAIECMIREISYNPDQEYKYILIADYNDPGKLINATTSFFLISENIPSPMGEYLSVPVWARNFPGLSPHPLDHRLWSGC